MTFKTDATFRPTLYTSDKNFRETNDELHLTATAAEVERFNYPHELSMVARKYSDGVWRVRVTGGFPTISFSGEGEAHDLVTYFAGLARDFADFWSRPADRRGVIPFPSDSYPEA